MKHYLLDIESFPNFFCVGIQDYHTKEKIYYEISEEHNDLDKIYHFIVNFSGYLITFNGIHYDEKVLKYLVLKYKSLKKLNWGDIVFELKHASQQFIENDQTPLNDEVFKVKTNWVSVDLFLYWAKMTRMSKKISLKSLGIQLGYPVVQELPYHHNDVIKKENLEVLRIYNTVHDLGILDLLYRKKYGEFEVRKMIHETYGIECYSMDASKIASETLLDSFCKLKRASKFYVRKQRFIKPYEIHFKDILVGFDPKFELKVFQDLWNDVYNSVNSFSKIIVIDEQNTNLAISYGVGGIHAVNKDEQYYSTETHIIKTSDIASLYPNLIINYGCIRFPEVLKKYKEIKTERLIAKAAKEKVKDTFLKLVLNNISGLLDMEHSWLYFPEGALRMRMIGQLFLSIAVEKCILKGWQVISVNTDGIECIIPKEDEQEYEQLLNSIAEAHNFEFEHDEYKKIIYKNVNAYVAVDIKNGVKRKGFFKFEEYEIPLGDSVDELVVSKALTAYYLEGIDVAEYISNPEKYGLHIYDYCKSNKIGKNYKVLYNNEIQQQLNRYYFSKKGTYLYKKKEGKSTVDNVNVGQPVILFNNYEEKPFEEYRINYSYYISKTKSIIDEINRLNQYTLF